MNKILNAQILNLDTHPSLFGERDIYYLLNGDIQGFENGNQSYFVQNQMSNSLCVELPEDYEEKLRIELDNNEVFLGFKKEGNYELGIANLNDCTYETIVEHECLNLEWRARGVYKRTNKSNTRRVYFIDGHNRNRFLDLVKVDGVWQYPKVYTGSRCESCDVEETEELDCDALNFNRSIIAPCISLFQTNFGTLNSGVYQIGIAYGDEDMPLTDYYLSQPIKIFSPTGNIGLDITIPCEDNTFSQVFLILISQTRENSLVSYKVGTYPISSTHFIVTNLSNATILSTDEVLLRRLGYDFSKHIATNGETLLLGNHGEEELLDYQQLAFLIYPQWKEIKVPKSKAAFYPSLMRDEIYAFAIEWFDKQGRSMGVFHIPGKAAEPVELEDAPPTNDIYETVDCEPVTLKKWQIENLAQVTGDGEGTCEDCKDFEEYNVGKYGQCAYWQAETLLYPNTEEFGEYACTPIRHHKMPSNELSHIHGDFTVEHVDGVCEDLDDGNGGTYEYCTPAYDKVIEEDCVNVLVMDFLFIPKPLESTGGIHPNVGGYRILVGDRTNNKSVLHKGLIYNLWEDTSTPGKRQLYSNYPFNDLTPDVFLETFQNANNANNTFRTTWSPPSKYLRDKFTYHSPNIHYQETYKEFGTELKVYGEEVGWIEGNTTPFYKHPDIRLGSGAIQPYGYSPLNRSINSVSHYSKFVPWSTPFMSRFEIEASQYLLPVRQITSDKENINNWLRESSFYASLNRDLADPTTKDVSRILKNEGNNDYNYNTTVTRDGVSQHIQGVSYYVGIKQKNPDQYGNLEQITYRPVTCIFSLPDTIGNTLEALQVFAGDVYITKHSLLRKMPMFTQWLSDVPIDATINYRDYRNVWFPRFWYDNLTVNSIDDEFNLDGQFDVAGGPVFLAGGYNYIFITGVIDFWCESEFIGDYRETDITPNGLYYPKIGFDEISRGDRVTLDNKFLYNLILLNGNIEFTRQNTDRTISDASFISIFSQKDNLQNQGDPWLQFLPLNYTVLPRIYGQFTGIHYTDRYNLFFIFENQILYSRTDYSLNLNEGGSLVLGQGDIFSQRLQPLSNEKTGYVGSIDPDSFINTRYGTFFLDRYRKRWFKWTGSLVDATGNLFSWFQEFLLDSEPFGESTQVVFDNYTEKIYLTEKNSWTWSYSPKMEGFISLHSFKPQTYITGENTYYSLDNTKSSGIWKHNSGGYQNYYGEQFDFEVGFVINENFANKELQSIQIFAEYIKKFGYNSNVVEKNKFFNKVMVYNNNTNTGLRNTVVKNLENPNQSLLQNSDIINPQVAEISQVHDNVYRFNKLDSILVNPSLPTVTWDKENYTVSNVNFAKNPITRDKMMGKWFKVHLRDETNEENKILVQLYVDKDTTITKQ